MTNNFLLLNSDKTEILLIGPKNSTKNILDHNLQLDGCTVISFTVKNLGVPYQSVTLDVTSEDRQIGISLRETNLLRV